MPLNMTSRYCSFSLPTGSLILCSSPSKSPGCKHLTKSILERTVNTLVPISFSTMLSSHVFQHDSIGDFTDVLLCFQLGCYVILFFIEGFGLVQLRTNKAHLYGVVSHSSHI